MGKTFGGTPLGKTFGALLSCRSVLDRVAGLATIGSDVALNSSSVVCNASFRVVGHGDKTIARARAG